MSGARVHPERSGNHARRSTAGRIMASDELLQEAADELQPSWQTRIVAALEGPTGLAVMVVMALFAMYGTDLWEASGPPPKHLDPVIYSISALVFFAFTIELLLLVWCKKSYFLSFFFWLDLLAALSLVPDVFMAFRVDLFVLLGGGEGGLAIARTARAARAGARSARIVRYAARLQGGHLAPPPSPPACATRPFASHLP